MITEQVYRMAGAETELLAHITLLRACDETSIWQHLKQSDDRSCEEVGRREGQRIYACLTTSWHGEASRGAAYYYTARYTRQEGTGRHSYRYVKPTVADTTRNKLIIIRVWQKVNKLRMCSKMWSEATKTLWNRQHFSKISPAVHCRVF